MNGFSEVSAMEMMDVDGGNTFIHDAGAVIGDAVGAYVAGVCNAIDSYSEQVSNACRVTPGTRKYFWEL